MMFFWSTLSSLHEPTSAGRRRMPTWKASTHLVLAPATFYGTDVGTSAIFSVVDWLSLFITFGHHLQGSDLNSTDLNYSGSFSSFSRETEVWMDSLESQEWRGNRYVANIQ